MEKLRILFVLPRMVAGGVEHVTLQLLRRFRQDGAECALALVRAEGELLDDAHRLVDVADLGGALPHVAIPRLVRFIRSYQPTHVVTAFSDVGVMTIIALAASRHRANLVHGVHDTLGLASAKPGKWGRVRHLAYGVMARFVFSHANAIVAVSDGVRSEVLARRGRAQTEVYRIYNPVIESTRRPILSAVTSDLHSPLKIVALGRLARQKGVDVLIDALAKISTRRAWMLNIYGDGPERGALEAQALALGLSDRITFCGYTRDPFGALAACDLFVMSSRHEGLGNTLIEALHCGLQVIATDCPHGPAEILDNDRYGQLVSPENPKALAAAIDACADGRVLFDRQVLIERSLAFTTDAAYRAWREVIVSVATHENPVPGHFS